MASPLSQAGALTEPSNYAPLHTNRMFTGLWTNRSPLRDAATSYLQEKYYSASRQDSILGGLNTEISSHLTLVRRPGTSVYNSQIFPPVSRFYEFRMFSAATESIRVMVDTAATVYDGTGPNTQRTIWTKSAGAGKTSFQAVGNTLYMGNGVDQVKYVGTLNKWTPLTAHPQGFSIIDSAGNIQTVAAPITASISQVYGPTGYLQFILQGTNPFANGLTVVPSGLTTFPALNGVSLVVTGTVGSSTVTADYAHGSMVGGNESGILSLAPNTLTGAVEPAWNETPGGYTYDGGMLWMSKGPATQAWGIVGPATAPTLAQANLPAVYPQWTANTVYSTSLLVVDTAGNIQRLTTGGVTGSAQPTWAAGLGALTADGTAVWTNQGTSAWQANHFYPIGAFISVTFTYYITVASSGGTSYNPYSGQPVQTGGTQRVPVTVTDFFTSTAAGNSASYAPTWVDGQGSVVADGQISWTNTGASATWTGAVGPGVSLSLARTIVDTNGNLQNILTSGKSGTNHPAWASATGGTTVDGGAVWTSAGPYSAANTQAWIYSYAFGNSVTKEKSNTSPLSLPVILGANSLVSLQGAGSPDPQVDTVLIYRTAQGGSTQFLLAQIPAPAPGAIWSYADTNTDAALNIFIQAATAFQLTPPPAGAVAAAYHAQRIFVAVGNTVSWSSGPDAIIFAAAGNSGFPPDNYIVFQAAVVRMWPTVLGLLVFLTSDIRIILGSGTATDPFYSLPFLDGTGLLSYDGFAVNGSTSILLSSSLMLVQLDPSAGVVEVGFPIADLIQASYGPESHITFHSQTSSDTALYAGDGVTGWYRMAATSAPESGFNWGTRSIINGGCRALASIETSPGFNQLLMGSNLPGPILCRDPNANQDVGVPFVAQTVLGSIVLAQPGQLAALQFLTLESTRAGTRPQLGILLGEIGGTFEAIVRTRQDPPNLQPSATLFSDRYAVAQNERPVYCRHFQLAINWPAEDARNELLTFTIFGSLLSEFKDQ